MLPSSRVDTKDREIRKTKDNKQFDAGRRGTGTEACPTIEFEIAESRWCIGTRKDNGVVGFAV